MGSTLKTANGENGVYELNESDGTGSAIAAAQAKPRVRVLINLFRVCTIMILFVGVH